MAVITPDGIVGKVIAAYPTASLVLLITDSGFAAGVISQKNRVRGTLKGQGTRSASSITSERREGRARRVVLHLRRRSHLPQGASRRQRHAQSARANCSRKSSSLPAALDRRLGRGADRHRRRPRRDSAAQCSPAADSRRGIVAAAARFATCSDAGSRGLDIGGRADDFSLCHPCAFIRPRAH